MALSILDGNQSATTLSTILTSGQHITAHTVVSLGTQAITDMRGAVSGSVVSISNLPATQTIAGTVTANVQPQQSDDTDPNIKFIPIGYATVDGGGQLDQWTAVDPLSPLPVYFPSNNPLPAGTNRIGVVTIGAGTVTIGAGTAQIGVVTIGNIRRSTDGATTQLTTEVGSGYLEVRSYIGAGTAQIGSVTASISGTVPISISSVTVGNSVTIGSFATSVTARLINPAGTAVTYAEVGTAGSPSIDVLSVQGVTSGTPINVYPQQGTTVSNTNFTSITASTTLVSAVTLRESLTVFSEGPGQLFISPGATATTISYQVRLSPGDYWECPQGQLSLLHTAVFSASGSTARVTQVS